MTSAPHGLSDARMSWLHTGLGAFIIFWLSAGMAAPLMNSLTSGVKIAVLGAWMILAAGRSMAFLSTSVIVGWPLVLMLLITVLYAVEVAQADQYTQGFGYLLIAFALTCFYSIPQYRRERHLLMGIMAVDLAVTGVRTFIALQTDPLVSRYLATTDEIRTAVYGSHDFAGIGGFSYAYSIAAVLLVLLYFLVRSRRARVPLAVLLIAGTIILFELAFTTAIVLVLMLGVVFLIRDLVQRREFQVAIYAAILVGYISGLYNAGLNAVAGQSWVTPVVAQRLVELSRFLSGEVSRGSDLGIRLGQWRKSIDAFLESGPLGLAGNKSSLNHGGHSEWLDLLASYGVYTLTLVLFFGLAWRAWKTGTSTSEVEPLKRAWIYFVALGFVNPILYSTILLTWMFFVPSLISWFHYVSANRSERAREGATV